jgi:hypothetical protein
VVLAAMLVGACRSGSGSGDTSPTTTREPSAFRRLPDPGGVARLGPLVVPAGRHVVIAVEVPTSLGGDVPPQTGVTARYDGDAATWQPVDGSGQPPIDGSSNQRQRADVVREFLRLALTGRTRVR